MPTGNLLSRLRVFFLLLELLSIEVYSNRKLITIRIFKKYKMDRERKEEKKN